MRVIPMPIHYGHGHVEPNVILALWIVLNGLCIITLIGYSISYYIRKPYFTWLDGITGETLGGTASTVVFCMINFMALLVYLVGIVKGIIESKP